jgi:transcription antitermination factor NusG
MAQAYTPGLLVTPRTRYRARRVLPIAGEVLVRVGDRVQARDVVARTELPGDVTPLNLAHQLSLPPGHVAECMLKREGERVEVGEVIARTKGIFGFFKSEYVSQTAGTIESISRVTGQVLVRGAPLPVEVRAFVTGEVTEVLPGEGCVVEAEVSRVQGIFGIGGEAFGPIRLSCRQHDEPLTPELITPQMLGAVVVGGARMTGEAVRRGVEVGCAAIVSGGIDDADLREILGYDLGVAITGTEQIGLTLIITEGFGEIAMAERTFQLLASREGAEASVTGATQIRAGVLRPEILIPVDAQSPLAATDQPGGGTLEVGSTVRIVRDPHFGVIGTVTALPPELHTLESGSRARVLVVRTGEGGEVTVPRANVELIRQ